MNTENERLNGLSQLKGKFENAVKDTAKWGEDGVDSLKKSGTQSIQKAEHYANGEVERVSKQVQTLMSRMGSAIQKNPVLTVVGIASVGFIAAKIFQARGSKSHDARK